jgi:hypothetical protein
MKEEKIILFPLLNNHNFIGKFLQINQLLVQMPEQSSHRLTNLKPGHFCSFFSETRMEYSVCYIFNTGEDVKNMLLIIDGALISKNMSMKNALGVALRLHCI